MKQETNPTASYVVFENGHIIADFESLKEALEFCLAVPGRTMYSRQYQGKPPMTT